MSMDQMMISVPLSEYKALVEASNTLNTIRNAYLFGSVSAYEWKETLALFFGEKPEEAEDAE